MGDLANDLVLERSALTHNIRPLQQAGLVALVKDEADQRSRRVVLIDAGAKTLAESKALWTVAHERFERLYGVEKAALLRGLLAEIYSDESVAASTADSRWPHGFPALFPAIGIGPSRKAVPHTA